MFKRRSNFLSLKESELYRWFSTISATALLSGTTTLITLVAGILVARLLPLDEVGKFGLLMALIQILPMIGSLGQPLLLKREYSNRDFGVFDWAIDSRNSFLLELPVLMLLAVGSIYIYHLSLNASWFIVIALPAVAILNIAFELLNAHQRYVWASLLLRVPNAITILPMALAFFVPHFARLDVLLITILLWMIGMIVVSALLLAKFAERGDKHIPFHTRWLGFGLMILVVTHVIPFQGLTALAGILVPMEQIAALTALAILLRPFNLLREIITQMMTVEFARNPALNKKFAFWGIWGLGTILGVLAVLLVPLVVSIVYGGRYDQYLNLVLPLSVSGALVILEILPKSFLIARVQGRTVNQFAGCQVLIALLGIGLGIALGIKGGVIGIAWAGAVMLLLRNACGYALYLFALRHEQVLISG